ncbi:hypothetical protein [Rhizorhabdus wittichii]|uniref:hypothetical protein n=1 Tax=Rhizorhabdus wittichii TaxID=160791 RepID=UPI001D009ADD|nr:MULTISPECIES: hypothetical protein [Sphingomonadaceae]
MREGDAVAEHGTTDEDGAAGDRLTRTINRCGEAVRIDASETALDPGVTGLEFTERRFEKAGNILEALDLEAIPVSLGESLGEPQIARPWREVFRWSRAE